MTEQDLQDAKIQDISILEIENNQKLLILLCDNAESSQRLYDIISTTNYNLTVSVNENNEYNLKIDFIDTDYIMYFASGRTVENYFPITWLAESKVSLITTGFKGEGQQRFWNDNYLNLKKPA